MPWFYLLIAGLLEIVWAYTTKQSYGFTRLIPSLVTILAMTASFWLLAIAMRSIPLGTAYTIWTGIGSVGAFLVGILWLAEPINALRVIAAVLIIMGLILMKLSSL
ncbi:multidrug efflux SMR transporter [Vibrio aestuarianus]|uniref:Guanidinium exporter n=1 Tax=Vibrio aestuarianus TaxID=28171 RepID=A0AAX3U7L8_9VIBR|nr:multidrug efflux SMR transporter [Vibrio aestuarianus]WGK83276.1 multidrug efflux SMR transporter [Vibrio aestuarianus]